MKIITSNKSNNKNRIVISKSEWVNIGKKSGWILAQNEKLEDLKIQLHALYLQYSERFRLLTDSIRKEDEGLVNLQTRIDEMENEIKSEVGNISNAGNIGNIK